MIVNFGYSQSRKSIKYYNKARVEVRENNFQAALEDLEKSLADSPDYQEAMLFKAQLHQDIGEPEKAIPLYEKSLARGGDYYVHLFYGKTLFETGDFAKAKEELQKYLESPRAAGKYAENASQLIENAEFAMKATANPKSYNPQNLGANVNGRGMEYFPSISADGQLLVFTHRDPNGEDSDEDFWAVERDEKTGEWGKAKPLQGFLNTPLNEGAQAVGSDANIIFFAACERREGFGSCDIFASFYRGNSGWSKPLNLGPNVNTGAWESQPSISSDGKTLYFVRGKNSTDKNIDIYVSKIGEDGKFQKAEKLEGAVNTSKQETSPFIHFDNQSLYFASNGHAGMGDLDFFVSRKQPDGTWGEPQNLGHPINTSGQEFSLIVAPDGKTGYFASDNLAGGFGLLDLYSFELPEESRAIEIAYIKGKVTNAKTGEPISAEISFADLEKNQRILEENSDKNGNYFAVLPSNSDYALNIQKEGFLFYSKNFSLATQSKERAFVLNVELIPIEIGQKVKLENIFFETDSFDLDKKSNSELQNVVSFLKENPTVKLTVEGHTDNVGSPSYNKNLSQKRAESVASFLIEKGIEKSRLKSLGFGESQPVATNETEEGRALNRRTELKITSFE